MNWIKTALLVVVTLLVVVAGYWWFDAPETLPERESLPEEEVELYFYHTGEARLGRVERELPEAADEAERVRQIVRELTNPPEQEELVTLMPDELELRSMYSEGVIVHLDFNDEIIGAAEGSSGEMMFLYSIVNSVLANLPDDYKLVQILVEGEMRKTMGPYGEESGHIGIEFPLGPRWDLTEQP